jgi:hypothetical protein
VVVLLVFPRVDVRAGACTTMAALGHGVPLQCLPSCSVYR